MSISLLARLQLGLRTFAADVAQGFFAISHNGLAVVTVERDACGGCFNSIPPQRQSEIRLHKKIIVCENCGRILVDADLNDSVDVK